MTKKSDIKIKADYQYVEKVDLTRKPAVISPE